jgi:hypothetical protein
LLGNETSVIKSTTQRTITHNKKEHQIYVVHPN